MIEMLINHKVQNWSVIVPPIWRGVPMNMVRLATIVANKNR